MSIKKTLKKVRPLVKAVRYIQFKRGFAHLKRNNYVSRIKGKKALFYFPYITTDEIQQGIYFGQKYYENDYLDYLCDEWHNGIIGKSVKGSVILDIGSNIGNHSLYFILERGANFSYCFEPAKDTFQIMKKNIEINHLESRTKLYNVGVGSKSGTARISKSKEKNTAYTQISLQDKGDIKVLSIDELNIQDKISLIKVDVEGFELEVLNGMKKTLKKYKPFIIIEIRDRYLKQIESILESIGYNIETMRNDEGLGDYVCFPKI